VNKAETYLVLQTVQSQWSFHSFDTLPEVLRVADPDSKVFAKLTMKRSKASMVVSHGLGPFFKEKLVASLASMPQNATNWRGRWIKACNVRKKGCWLNTFFCCESGNSGITRCFVHYFLKNMHYFQFFRH